MSQPVCQASRQARSAHGKPRVYRRSHLDDRQLDDPLLRFANTSFAKLISLETLRAFTLPWTGEAASRERAPGNDADPFGLAEPHHFALFFTIEQIVMILHRNETGPSVEIGQIKRFGELPCEHGRGADITNFAGFD